MDSGSLRFRLIALWAVFLVITIQAAALGLQTLFEHSIMSRTVDELTLDLQLLTEALTTDGQGDVRLLTAPAGPQFAVAYSGRYWQISQNGQALLRSPSLWDFKLTVDLQPLPPNTVAEARYEGPDNQSLFAMIRTVSLENGDLVRNLSVVTAVDTRELARASQRFSGDLMIGLTGLAALLLLAASAHVVIGLRPLRDIQDRLSKVRSGEIRRLEGPFPREVMPLVAETNALLNAQDTALAAARTHAGNLAHGLKTPLAVMTAQARILRRRGDHVIADRLDAQIEVMRRHIERELARARARGAGRTHHQRINTAVAIRELVDAVMFLPKGQELVWDLDVTEVLMLAVDRTDFHEIMGNLIDNAHKWARTTVRVQSRLADRSAVFIIDDDGPGVADADLVRILERGERADSAIPGSGLGLAIASDVIAAYDGRIELRQSPLGGLSAIITLPVRQQE